MTAKEYLRQAYRLDHRINSDLAELERLRDMEGSISLPASRNTITRTATRRLPSSLP